jgi:heme exporter protein D
MFNLAFKNFSEILDMGGHGIYVWSVYLIGISIKKLKIIIEMPIK